jgi:serine/threonine protein kinase
MLPDFPPSSTPGNPELPADDPSQPPSNDQGFNFASEKAWNLPSPLHTSQVPALPLPPTAVQPPGTPFAGKEPAPAFAGFETLGVLGWGGMGIVYRARDLRRQHLVALKTMQRFDPATLYRFKQEFRALADLTHPNLVRLYDLIADGDQWFFTMEFVEGVNFLHFVRGAAAGAAPKQSIEPEGLVRLRNALRQLVDGVAFLHTAGKLHRDIKPTNVLVTGEGRVVLLDFGLAADLDQAGQYQSTEQHIVGTAAYMAPEQGSGQGVTAASDWYAVGVMLYEALTGRLPFTGPSLQILLDKQRGDPPAPHALDPSAPEDLSALCMELLCREAAARPSGNEVLARLGKDEQTPPVAVPLPQSSISGMPLVGRARHLEALEEAFQSIRQGQTVLVYVHGQSGMGKTALVQQFLDGLVERRAAVVLAGRCYEQESVPYKALDSLVDALSRYLRRLPEAEAQALLPRDVGALARVFPVLRQVGALANAPQRGAEIPDQHELRRRAFGALRELLARVGDRTALVLSIDDLQWGDVDSAALLAELVRPPDAPVLLLLCCYRSEDVSRSKCLQALLSESGLAGLQHSTVAVEALTHEEARDLAKALLGAKPSTSLTLAEAMARESKGSPFFVYELVQAFQAAGDTEARMSPGEVVALDEVLSLRIGRLPAEARRLLEVVAVAGRPLGRLEAFSAAELSEWERDRLALLRSGRLLRSTGLTDEDEIETYHDRIRETVIAHLTTDTWTQHHRRLAEVMEASGRADPQVLAVHYHGANQPERAGRFYAMAAAQAAETLAFDRAAKLYRIALELRPVTGEEERQLRRHLADALANAGRGVEAAREYVGAAADAGAGEALDLRQRAAAQLMYSGNLDEGLELLREILDELGLPMPRTARRALLGLLYWRGVLWLRGLRFRLRDPGQIPDVELHRIDLCCQSVTGLTISDIIYGAYFQARHLLLALRAGEPFRLVRALALEAGHVSSTGTAGARRAEALLRTAEELAQQIDQPYTDAFVLLTKSVMVGIQGHWVECRNLCMEAEGILRTHCTGVTWELVMVNRVIFRSLAYTGDFPEVNRRLPLLLQEARDRNDRYAETNLATFVVPLVRLAADDPAAARKQVRESMSQWSHKGFHVQHFTSLVDEVQIDLYLGDASAAWERIRRHWPDVAGSLLLRIQQLRISFYHTRARSALGMAVPAGGVSFLRTAERDCSRLERENVPWAAALARLVRGGLAAARRAPAVELLQDAINRFEALDMFLHAAAARRRLGELVGGAEGAALVTQADEWMCGHQIINPRRMTAMLAPGFPV